MRMTIHRGSRQIGGSVTEYSAASGKLFIDLGANLPGNGAPLPVIDGLTIGSGEGNALFITHAHGDHIGAIDMAMPNIPIYMGKASQAIELVKTQKLQDAEDYVGKQFVTPEYVARIESAKTFTAPGRIAIGDFTVTPLWVDHSAFDAYMFVIEADGIRVLHTGDFRMHGPRGKAVLKVLSLYAKDVDYIVCEGTMLSRGDTSPDSEWELAARIRAAIDGKKYIFAVCSSTNIDRIAVFYCENFAGDRRRRFLVDRYQRDVLNVIDNMNNSKSSFYDFKFALPWYPGHANELSERGFFALIRGNGGRFDNEILEKYFDQENSLLIYSMWDGYLDPNGAAKNEKHIALWEKYQPRVILHTSGHASADALRKVYRAVKPKRGLIPMHSEAPERFKEIIPDGQILFVADGETITL